MEKLEQIAEMAGTTLDQVRGYVRINEDEHTVFFRNEAGINIFYHCLRNSGIDNLTKTPTHIGARLKLGEDDYFFCTNHWFAKLLSIQYTHKFNIQDQLDIRL